MKLSITKPQKKKKNQKQGKMKALSTQVKLMTLKKPRPSVQMRDVHDACALTDPFCAHARGARLPTSGKARTLAYPAHARSYFGTDATGVGAVLILPDRKSVV